MKNISVFFAISIVMVACSGEVHAWQLKERVDKVSGDKSISVVERFEDADAPGVLIQVKIECTNNETLTGEIHAYRKSDSRGLKFRGWSNENKVIQISTRVGKSRIDYFMAAEEYYNVGVFLIPLTVVTMTGGELKFDKKDGFEIFVETAPLFKGDEWHIKVPTQSGSPVITIDLTNRNVKKIFSACKWEPGVSPKKAVAEKSTPKSESTTTSTPSVSPTVSASSPSASPPVATSEKTASSASVGAENPKTSPADNIKAPPVAMAKEIPPAKAQDTSPFSPSFDCQKASSGPERLICSDRELSRLDVELSQSYMKARDKTEDKKTLRSDQLTWMKSRRNACSDKACMAQAYKDRIAQLK